MGLTTKVKRGDQSMNYFGQAFGILTVVIHSAIAVIDTCWIYKILAIILASVFIFYLCFISNWGRNKIVGIFSKIQNKVEIRKH